MNTIPKIILPPDIRAPKKTATSEPIIVKPKQGGHDLTTHSLLSLHQPPEALLRLRELLQHSSNAAISAYASKGKDFEECLARIGVALDVVLDGQYHPIPLFEMFIEQLENRIKYPTQPHLRSKSDTLLNVELVEREGEVTLEPILDKEQTITSAREMNKAFENLKLKDDLTGESVLAPFTVCNDCTTWFECCENRICGFGKQ